MVADETEAGQRDSRSGGDKENAPGSAPGASWSAMRSGYDGLSVSSPANLTPVVSTAYFIGFEITPLTCTS
jgi:hypothetical protein